MNQFDTLAAFNGLTPTLDGSYNQIVGTSGADDLTGTAEADAIYGLGGDDTLSGQGGHDLLYGGAGNDLLRGGTGADMEFGGKGDDTLAATAGSDMLNGGEGADTFVFSELASSTVDKAGRDLVIFSHAEGDVFNLSQMDANATVDGDQAFTLVDQFSGQAGELIIKAHGSSYVVKGDVNGDGHADFAIDVHSATPLDASDFVL